MSDLLKHVDRGDQTGIGNELHQFAADLYPICRSITGDGLRQTLAMVRDRVPLQIVEVPTGTEIFDWTVPKEWNIREAYIKDPAGQRVLDFREHNLHVLNYSVPVHKTMALSELNSPVYASRLSGLDSISDVVLQGKLGILFVS